MRLGLRLFAVGIAIMVCILSYLVGKKSAVYMWYGNYEMAAAGVGVIFLITGSAVYIANLVYAPMDRGLEQ